MESSVEFAYPCPAKPVDRISETNSTGGRGRGVGGGEGGGEGGGGGRGGGRGVAAVKTPPNRSWSSVPSKEQ